MNILIAIESCHKDRSAQHMQRTTWLRDLRIAEYRFFLGNPGLFIGSVEDETFLNVPDGYESLSLKTQAMCNWAWKLDFDFMFKCDIDTLVNPVNLLFSGFEDFDYMGGENADVNVPGFEPGRIEFCSGGAGYWLSKKALTIVAKADIIQSPAEDVFVADALLKHGVAPAFHPGYKWRPGATFDKDTVSLHLSSALQKKYGPKQMYEFYKDK